MATMNFNGPTTIGQIQNISGDQTNHYNAPFVHGNNGDTTRNVNIGNVTGVLQMTIITLLGTDPFCFAYALSKTGGSGGAGGDAAAAEGSAAGGNGGNGGDTVIQ